MFCHATSSGPRLVRPKAIRPVDITIKQSEHTETKPPLNKPQPITPPLHSDSLPLPPSHPNATLPTPLLHSHPIILPIPTLPHSQPKDDAQDLFSIVIESSLMTQRLHKVLEIFQNSRNPNINSTKTSLELNDIPNNLHSLSLHSQNPPLPLASPCPSPPTVQSTKAASVGQDSSPKTQCMKSIGKLGGKFVNTDHQPSLFRSPKHLIRKLQEVHLLINQNKGEPNQEIPKRERLYNNFIKSLRKYLEEDFIKNYGGFFCTSNSEQIKNYN